VSLFSRAPRTVLGELVPGVLDPGWRHASCAWSGPGRPVPSRPGHVGTARGRLHRHRQHLSVPPSGEPPTDAPAESASPSATASS